MSSRQSIETARLQPTFFFDSIAAQRIILVLLIANVIIVVALIAYLLTQQKTAVHFHTTYQTRLTTAASLDQAHVSEAELINWVGRAVRHTFSFNVLQQQQQLVDAKASYFTERGSKVLEQCFNQPDGLINLTHDDTIQTAMPTAAPRILTQGIEPGAMVAYTWLVEVPIELNRYNQQITSNKDYRLIRLHIRRISTTPTWQAINLDKLSGIAIDNIIIKPLSRFAAYHNTE